jgi:quercetin dioxygenase-like cupin family protein
MKIISTEIKDPEKIRKILKEEGYEDIFVWEDQKGSFYDWHTHPYEEVRWICKGEITIGTEHGEITLKAGDRLDLPAGTRHWAKTDTGVVYICGSKSLGGKHD